ncbi:helix-turn-helix domain-containing protein [Puia sp. P3]|uniref:helix-turn-helix domain-containing protein n=1 Tax=Puia sp. P3 TaxID=3423952 RepID=UPI003D66FE9F
MISFLARHAAVDVHYHQCFQIVVSLKNPVDSVIDGVLRRGLCGFIVNQYIHHSCRAEDSPALVYFIDAESYQGWQLKQLLDGRAFVPIDFIPGVEDEDMVRFSSAVLERVLRGSGGEGAMDGRNGGKRVMDERVAEALAYIDDRLDQSLELEEVAGKVFLSSERLRHLFVQEVGVAFSQYVLWKRMKNVIYQVLQKGLPMSAASVQSGFTDQAHFTRIFRRTFGVPAKEVLKNSRYVQFLTPYVEVVLPS